MYPWELSNTPDVNPSRCARRSSSEGERDGEGPTDMAHRWVRQRKRRGCQGVPLGSGGWGRGAERYVG